MYTSFYVTENRLDELKSFIRNSTPSARFNYNPQKEGNKWFISLNIEVGDSNKLNKLFNKWHEEDNPPKIKTKSIWKRMFNIFK